LRDAPEPERERLSRSSDVGDYSVDGRTDRAGFEIRPGVTAVGELLAKLGLMPQKPLQRAYRQLHQS
jgi:hypothetical protein